VRSCFDLNPTEKCCFKHSNIAGSRFTEIMCDYVSVGTFPYWNYLTWINYSTKRTASSSRFIKPTALFISTSSNNTVSYLENNDKNNLTALAAIFFSHDALNFLHWRLFHFGNEKNLANYRHLKPTSGCNHQTKKAQLDCNNRDAITTPCPHEKRF